MNATAVLTWISIGLPIVTIGGAVFATIKWRVPSLIKRVDAIEEHDYVKKSELYDESGETKYQPVSRCDGNMAACQEMLTKELQVIGVNISSLKDGHESLQKEVSNVDKSVAVMDQRLSDFIKFHTKE